MLMIDADKVDTDLLRNAKAIASLALDLATDNQVDVFPHHLGGGWPAVRPGNDDMVTYGRIQAGQYKGVSATAYGANKQVRHRGLAIALFLSVVRLHPRVFPDRAASQNTALLSLVALAKSEHNKFSKKSVARGPVATSASRGPQPPTSLAIYDERAARTAPPRYDWRFSRITYWLFPEPKPVVGLIV